MSSPLEVTGRGNEDILLASARIIALDASPQVVVGGIEECCASADQSRFGIMGILLGVVDELDDTTRSSSPEFLISSGEPLDICRLGSLRVISHK